MECIYCKPRGKVRLLDKDDVLRLEEALRIISIAAEFGISKIRFTGGEPLRKRRFEWLFEAVSRVQGIKTRAVTTNGVLLAQKFPALLDAGIRKINVSLDTLISSRFNKITGVDALDRVLEGIHLAASTPRIDVKLNMVVLKGINDDEIPSFVRFGIESGVEVRFIEQMQIEGLDSVLAENSQGFESIIHAISKHYSLRKLSRSDFDGPAIRYLAENRRGSAEIGIIPAVSKDICVTCNRLRITATGTLKNCLFNNRGIDLLGPMRSGCDDDEVASLFREATALKEEAKNRVGSLNEPSSDLICGMWKTGG